VPAQITIKNAGRPQGATPTGETMIDFREPIDKLVRLPKTFTKKLKFPKPEDIRIYDDTLRDGEQMPGVAFSPEGKLEMAKFLSENGFAFLTLETGFQKEHRKYREFIRSKTKLELAMLYLDLMKEFGLKQGENGLEVYVMCEIPSNVILAKYFLNIFDGMSIGSNDLTQLVLGLDRDSALISQVGDERNEAVKEMIGNVITECKNRKKYVGICGEAPSYFPDFAEFLVERGIESISLNPDIIVQTTLVISQKEKQLKGR